MDIRQSKNYAKYMGLIGWIVENGIFIRKLPLLSFLSVIKVQRPKKIDLPKIKKLSKKYHAFLVKVEPDINTKYEILNTKYKPDDWPLLPTKTLVLDLDSISLGSLPKDTRYEIRSAQKRRLLVKKSSFIESFYEILQETMKIGHWSVPIHKEVTSLYRAFQPNNSAILLTYSPTLLLPTSGCLLIWDSDTAHYMYAANTARGRELGAAYLTLSEAIKFCQKKGLRYLDLEGIYDERYPSQTKNWQGFTKFKMGWGGKVVEYPGSYSRYFFSGF